MIEALFAATMGALFAYHCADLLHHQHGIMGPGEEDLTHPLPSTLPYGTVREYGHITSNAQRSWLYRHYRVPYRKHGRLFIEPGPNDHRLGLARETRPGDDTYHPLEAGSLTVDLFHT